MAVYMALLDVALLASVYGVFLQWYYGVHAVLSVSPGIGSGLWFVNGLMPFYGNSKFKPGLIMATLVMISLPIYMNLVSHFSVNSSISDTFSLSVLISHTMVSFPLVAEIHPVFMALSSKRNNIGSSRENRY